MPRLTPDIEWRKAEKIRSVLIQVMAEKRKMSLLSVFVILCVPVRTVGQNGMGESGVERESKRGRDRLRTRLEMTTNYLNDKEM